MENSNICGDYLKQQTGIFVKNMFQQMDDCRENDPRKYMELVKKIRDGSFDKQPNSDTDSISPEDWKSHFSDLLGPKITKNEHHNEYENFVSQNVEKCNQIFEKALDKNEILRAVKSLKNNKSSSFDRVTNEMIKASMPALLDPIFLLFKTLIENSLYPTTWKTDILSPIHKKGGER